MVPKTIIRSPKGTARREVNIEDIQIPDLWSISTWLKDLDDCRTKEYPHTKHSLIDGQLKKAGEDILECWHLTHDLLKNIRGDIGSC